MRHIPKGVFEHNGDLLTQVRRPWRHETVRYIGVDETNGRYADVTVFRCAACGRLWLHYHVEYEHIPASGRWARGLIDDASAVAIKPEETADYLDDLEWYIYGARYMGTVAGGAMGRLSGIGRRGSGTGRQLCFSASPTP